MMNEELKKQLRNRRICVVIPTYNNDKTIKTVVEKCLLYCDDVIVVTDGCTDRTTDILHAIDGITIVSYVQNRGKGYALKMGFRRALEMGFSYAITLDGDGQHYPEDIPLFLKANQQHPQSLIIGSRQLEGVDRISSLTSGFMYRQAGHYLTPRQVIGSILYTVCTDCHCSLHAMKRSWNCLSSPLGMVSSLSQYPYKSIIHRAMSV